MSRDMWEWLNHIHKSTFCYTRYPGIIAHDGRDACPCGWVASRPPEPTPKTKTYTIGQLVRHPYR